MTMIEQVARALCLDDGIVPDQVNWDGWYEWEYYRDNAIAAITAMREPTDLMGNALNRMGRPYDAGSHSATEIWRALIDAALEEGE